MEAAERIRSCPANALPLEYHGQFPPRPKFLAGCPAPLTMWPRSVEDENEAFWPQNGTPRTV
eukprot:1372210-Lingulodinium_polyedra.AAC.1